MLRYLVIASALLSAFCASLDARSVKQWTDAELLRTADVVAIIRPLESKKNADALQVEGFKPEDFIGISTKCSILAVFKGNIEEKDLVIHHFCYSPQKTSIADGALFILFPMIPHDYKIIVSENGKDLGNATRYQYVPAWLAYLKKQADGSYIPVTPQFDAALSFKPLLGVDELPGVQLPTETFIIKHHAKPVKETLHDY